MNKFHWGNMGSGVYCDENVRGMASDLRIQAGLLALQLIHENKRDSALKVLDLVNDSISEKSSPYNYFETLILQGYYEAKAYDKANKLAKQMFDTFENWAEYIKTLSPDNQKYYENQLQEYLSILETIAYHAQQSGQTDVFNDFETRLKKMQQQGFF
jgi:tRNA isopentenyl-2-thiomethyl-A-37 hydroxylase MiaE